ncbi:MAG: hypothetical protein KKD44_11520 [Proteobacteria bacterium]|nr:hypothetical protein [Pseudomonadota bacterium]
MSFKQNLLKKIKLDQMRKRVLVTLGPSGSGTKVDKNAMKNLVIAAGLRHKKLRGLDLYLAEGTEDKAKQKILVLDNDLAVYDTTLDDVALRKEPTVKEMISIKNAIKILNDKDVVVSRKDMSVETVYAESISRLDLSFTHDDIKKLEYEGRAAVEWNDTEAVLESLSLFGELLAYGAEPKAFKIDGYAMMGAYSQNATGEDQFGPAVVFSIGDGTIKLIEQKMVTHDKEEIKSFHDQVLGRKDPARMGPSVIEYMASQVLAAHPDMA